MAVYGNDDGDLVTMPVVQHMRVNARWQFVLLYTEPDQAKMFGMHDVNVAVLDGAIQVGEQAGLPLHVFPLDRIAEAHRAAQEGVVGKILIA